MDKLKSFIYVCCASMVFVGMICVNISWIVFLLILGAIIFKVHYPIFSLTHISLIGTPLELFLGGLFAAIWGYLIAGFMSYYEN